MSLRRGLDGLDVSLGFAGARGGMTFGFGVFVALGIEIVVLIQSAQMSTRPVSTFEAKLSRPETVA
jgi:hypothetical protein